MTEAAAVTVKRPYLKWVVCICMLALVTTGISGAYLGSATQAVRNDREVQDLKDQIAAQKLDYEKRLGTQSAAYALDVNNFGKAVESFGRALALMDAKNDRRAAQRERAQAEAILAAQQAALSAATAAKKTDQILAKQDAVQQQVTESVAAVKATERKIDTAVRPVAAVPARPWSEVGGR